MRKHKKDKRIVITGANGYIGSSLIAKLLQKGSRPIALVRHDSKMDLPFDVEVRQVDPMKPEKLSDAIADADIIFHLAGLKGSDRCSDDPCKSAQDNIFFTKMLVESASNRNVKIIFTSTYWVYGNNASLPFKEDSIPMPSEQYGWSKTVAEQVVHNSGLNHLILRLANIFGYGSGKKYDDVTALFLKKAMRGEEIVLDNGGMHCIDLLYIDELSNLLSDMAEMNSKNMILNVGGGMPVSILNLARCANAVSKSLTGRCAKIIKGDREDNKVLFSDRWMDISKIKKLMRFDPAPLKGSLKTFAKDLLSEGGI